MLRGRTAGVCGAYQRKKVSGALTWIMCRYFAATVKLTKIDADRAFVDLVSHDGCVCFGFD